MFCQTDAEDRKLFEKAMKRGYVESALPLVLFVGVTGSGKTLFKRLLLGQSVPEFSPSTPLTEPAVRTAGNKEWKIVGPKEMMDMVADAVKGKVSLLDSTSDIACSGPQEHSEQPESTPTPLLEQAKHNSEQVDHVQPQTNAKHDSIPKSVTSVQPQGSVPQQNTTHSYKKSLQDALREIEIDSRLLERVRNPPNDVVEKLMEVDFFYLLDSGGQPPFREMLPHFVQKAAAIALMMKLNERLDFRPTIRYREKGSEDMGYESELTNEQILHQYIQGVQSHKSRVFIVGTHKDKESECQSETREMKNDKLLKYLQPVLQKQMELYGNQLIFPVDCTSRGSYSERIAHEFRTRVMENCMGERVQIPLSFFMLDQLLKLVSKYMEVKVLSIDECSQAAGRKLHANHSVFKVALNYLSKLNIIFYRPDILSKVVFPDPKDVLNMLTELVRCSHALRTNNEDVASTQPRCMQGGEGLLFRDFAQVNAQLLENAFPSHYRKDLFSAINFLELLRGLLIAAKLDDGNHFIPSLLPNLCKEKVSQHRVKAYDNPAPLVIHYPKMWLPVGVMPSLVVYLMNGRKWGISIKDSKPSCLYHNCIKFKLPGGRPRTVILINSTRFLEVHVKSEAGKVDSKLCHRIRKDIMDGLEKAHESLHYDPPKAENGFLCSGVCGNTDEPHLAILDDEKETWTCFEDDSKGGTLIPRECIWFEELKITVKG